MQFKIEHIDIHLNLLKVDGRVEYVPAVFDIKTSDQLFDALLKTLDWQADQLVMFGKKITTQRKVAWVGDENCSYTYSGVKKFPQPWTENLLLIKDEVEKLVSCKFNSCLLNLYHNGNEGMGWHSDDELELDENAPIVSISLGAIRKFAFKHKLHKTTNSIFLDNGSALLMYPPTQKFWNHSLLKTKQVVGPRINLTFRAIKPDHMR
jgi:alkylated DNA repair dioxygenase AlkB